MQEHDDKEHVLWNGCWNDIHL